MKTEFSLECPNCHKSDKVEKVSDIVKDGFSTSPEEGAETFEWADQVYYIHYKEREPTGEKVSTEKLSTSRAVNAKAVTYNWNTTPRERITISPLANRLLPQIEKPDPPPQFFKNKGCWFYMLWPLMWPFRVLTGRLTNWVYLNNEADYSQKIRELPQAQVKWKQLFYCYRCEGVFSEQTEFIPVGQLNNYLFDLKPERWFKSKIEGQAN